MKKRLFLSSAIMTGVLAVALSTGTYAWYQASGTGAGMSVSATEANISTAASELGSLGMLATFADKTSTEYTLGSLVLTDNTGTTKAWNATTQQLVTANVPSNKYSYAIETLKIAFPSTATLVNRIAYAGTYEANLVTTSTTTVQDGEATLDSTSRIRLSSTSDAKFSATTGAPLTFYFDIDTSGNIALGFTKEAAKAASHVADENTLDFYVSVDGAQSTETYAGRDTSVTGTITVSYVGVAA
jgi:hypothetical protein